MNRNPTWRLGASLVTVLLAAATVAAGCGGGGGGGGGGGEGGTLVDGTTDSVTNIDPAGSYDLGTQTVQYQIFQHLLEAGPGGTKPHPVLATKCGFRGGGLTTYACTLRSGVKFHNGKTMTAADVVASFERVVKIEDESGIYTLLSNMKSVKAEGKTPSSSS